MLPFMKDLFLYHESDKVRACALFALQKQMRHRHGNTKIIGHIKQLLCLVWKGGYEHEIDAYDWESGKKSEEELAAERREQDLTVLSEIENMHPIGLLTKLASGKASPQ